MLYDETVRRGRSQKLSSRWIGPYEVIEVNKVNATIKKGHKLMQGAREQIKTLLLKWGRLSG